MVSAVINNIIGLSKALFTGKLGGENSMHLSLAHVVSRTCPRKLQLNGHIDYNGAIHQLVLA